VQSLVKASGAYLPSLPASHGRTLVLPQMPVAGGASLAVWVPERCPVPGWSLERLKTRGLGDQYAVPVAPGQISRYEFSSDDDLVVAQYRVVGRRTSLWVSGSFGFRLSGKGSHMWRFVPQGGAEVVGSAMLGLLRVYQALVVREWTGVFTAQTVVSVRISSQSGSKSKYVGTHRCGSGVSRMLVHMPCGYVGPVRLSVSGRHLRTVEVHGVLVSAVGGVVTVIVGATNMAVYVDVGSGGLEADVEFEVIVQPEVRVAYKPLPALMGV